MKVYCDFRLPQVRHPSMKFFWQVIYDEEKLFHLSAFFRSVSVDDGVFYRPPTFGAK